jgi:hypothetical protein
MISQSELDVIIDGNWIVDCPTMSLIPACAGTESYQGAGYIEQSEKYKLRFKLISVQKTGISLKPEPTQAGQLYAPEEHWRLLARDIHGREWVSEGILPDVLQDEGIVVTGNLRYVTSSEVDDQAQKPDAINLWFLGDFEVTFNQVEMTTTTIGGEQVALSGEWKSGKFTLGRKDFFVRKESGWLFLEVTSPTCEFLPFYAARVEESLEFVLGRPARATVLLKKESDLFSLEIRSLAPAPNDAHAKPPYPPPIKDREQHFWRLFGLHLNHIEGYGFQSRSPLSRAWQYIVDSRRSALEIRALALGVGMEALLRVFFPMGDSDATVELEAAKKIINGAQLVKNIKKRLLGTIDGMGQVSPSDKLYQLIDRGVISREQFQAWKRIRNRAAHAGEFSLDDASIRDCNMVLTAAHRIVFDALGYQGGYKDYGTPGWPELTFPEAT